MNIDCAWRVAWVWRGGGGLYGVVVVVVSTWSANDGDK